jgi:hypothetical protein
MMTWTTWTITNANVAKSYTCITWERECGGVKQTLTVMAWKEDMTLLGRSVWEQVTVERSISGHAREYIDTDDEVTHYFNKTMFLGDAA